MTGPDGTGDAAGDLWVRLLGALERPCPVCGGAGRMRSREWRAWRARTDELVRVVEAARRAATMPAGDGAPQVPHVPSAPPAPPEIGAVNRGNGGPPQRDPYDTDPYRTAPYAPGPSQTDPYPGDSPKDDWYADSRYSDERYSDDRYEPDPYPIDGDDFYDGEIDPGEGMLRALVARAGRQPVPQLPAEEESPPPPKQVPGNRPARPATGPQPTVPITASTPPQPQGPPAAIVSALDRAINEHIRARPTGPEVVPCEECRGTGRTLSEAGVGLTQFLKRYGLVWADPGMNGQGSNGQPMNGQGVNGRGLNGQGVPPVQRRDGPFPPSA